MTAFKKQRKSVWDHSALDPVICTGKVENNDFRLESFESFEESEFSRNHFFEKLALSRGRLFRDDDDKKIFNPWSVRIITNRGGTREMISTLKGETLWLSVCDDSSASICHLEGDEKKPIEKYEVLKDTKINFLHHVTINARKRLEESYNRARVREIE